MQSTDISRQDQGLSTEQEQKLEEALLVGEGSEAVASGNTSQSRAVQPGMQEYCMQQYVTVLLRRMQEHGMQQHPICLV